MTQAREVETGRNKYYGIGTHLYRTEERRCELHGSYLESETGTSGRDERPRDVRLVGQGELPKYRVCSAINPNQSRAATELKRVRRIRLA
jgi:hypothetical protein